MPETPGLRLKVLASGLHQLANKCEKIAGELYTTTFNIDP